MHVQAVPKIRTAARMFHTQIIGYGNDETTELFRQRPDPPQRGRKRVEKQDTSVIETRSLLKHSQGKIKIVNINPSFFAIETK